MVGSPTTRGSFSCQDRAGGSKSEDSEGLRVAARTHIRAWTLAEGLMSILGKVLIFFNLLAAGAFTYFTLENWRARQDLTWAAFQREVQLDGIPLEASTTPPADLEGDRVPFVIVINENRYESVPKAKLDAIIPAGGDVLGGSGVKDQTEEVKRLQAKVFAHIGTAAPAAAD